MAPPEVAAEFPVKYIPFTVRFARLSIAPPVPFAVLLPLAKVIPNKEASPPEVSRIAYWFAPETVSEPAPGPTILTLGPTVGPADVSAMLAKPFAKSMSP